MMRMNRTRASGSCPALSVSDPSSGIVSAGTGVEPPEVAPASRHEKHGTTAENEASVASPSRTRRDSKPHCRPPRPCSRTTHPKMRSG